ncbi:MAG: hypothetical protein ACE148_16965 [Vicinamibacterales bacterium]
MSAANLDLECARLGEQLGNQADDKTLTDALSVLEEQGVYAFFLFLAQKNERRGVTRSCRTFLEKLLPGAFGSQNDEFRTTQDIATDIDKLLLARDLLRHSLIYGRYHAKAGGKGAER